METMGLISLGVVGSILPDLVRSVGFTLHMGVEVLVAAALPLLHTKAGQRLAGQRLAGQRLLVLVVAALPLPHAEARQRLQQSK